MQTIRPEVRLAVWRELGRKLALTHPELPMPREMIAQVIRALRAQCDDRCAFLMGVQLLVGFRKAAKLPVSESEWCWEVFELEPPVEQLAAGAVFVVRSLVSYKYATADAGAKARLLKRKERRLMRRRFGTCRPGGRKRALARQSARVLRLIRRVVPLIQAQDAPAIARLLRRELTTLSIACDALAIRL